MKSENKNNGRIALGIILILFGSILFLSNMEIIRGIKPIIFSWPVIMLVIGIIFLFTHKDSHTGFILMLIGGIGLIAKLNHTSFRYIFREYWPALLIVFGIYLLFNKNNYHKVIK
jgi:hypothetical protein